MIESLLRWAGGSPTHYWAIATLAGVALLALALRPGRTRPWIFLVALAVCLLAFRWPGIVRNVELGVDESQAIAGALTLKSNPVFWKYVDGTTVGPLNIYPLTVLGWLGFPIDYTTTRLFALAMIWVALASVYWLLRESFDEQLARIAVLPPAAFFSLSVFVELVHYSSEHVPIALLGVGSAWLWRAIQKGSRLAAFFGTAALGAVPWAKLQAAPVAMWFAMFGGGLLAWRTWRQQERLRPIMACWLAGGLFATAGFALLLTIWGLWAQWKTSYIGQALVYKSAGSTMTEMLTRLPELARTTPGVLPLLLPLAVVIFLLLGAVVFRPGRQAPLLTYLAGGAIASLYAFAAPGRLFPHYVLLLIIPLSLFAVGLVGAFLENTTQSRPTASRWLPESVLAGFLLIALVPQIQARTRDHPFLPFRPGSMEMESPEIVQLILAHASPGDLMSVWGWLPRLYVQSGLKQATREGHTENQIRPTSLRPFYRHRYLFDFGRRTPRVFVDAVGPGHFAFTDRAEEGFESWPGLAAIIHEQFEFVGEADGCRVYVRRGSGPES